MSDIVLQTKDLGISFGGLKAVSGVNLQIEGYRLLIGGVATVGEHFVQSFMLGALKIKQSHIRIQQDVFIARHGAVSFSAKIG